MNQYNGIDAPEWIDAEEASRLLDVKRSTLYAYASRGLLRSVPVEGTRARRYARADLERLRARKRARQSDGAHAASALRFGEPVLESQLCSIGPDGHTYRGHSALGLARDGARFESVCDLLWTERLSTSSPEWAPTGYGTKAGPLAKLMTDQSRPIDGLSVGLLALAQKSEDRFDSSDEAALLQAKRIVWRGIASLGLNRGGDQVERAVRSKSCAESLLIALGGTKSRAAARALDAALVVVADHELNSSAFAARVAASVGADLYSSTLAAILTLSGPEHGGACERVEAMIEELTGPDNAVGLVRERLRRGSRIPGFGHPLYPNGDPRGEFLLRQAKRLAPSNRTVRSALALADAMALAGNQAPNLDLGLCAMSGALRLPKGGGLAIFAAGRLAGWIAHALEQRAAGYQLRPRARYTGR